MSARKTEEKPVPVTPIEMEMLETPPPADGGGLRPPDEILDLPPADAPTQQFETHVPGTSAAAAARAPLRGNILLRPFILMREGLRPSNLKSSYGRGPLVIIMLVGMIGTFATTATNLALPDIQKAFKANLSSIINLIVWVGFFATLLSVPLGYLGDRARRVTIYAAGSMLSALGVLFTGLSPNRAALYGSISGSSIGDLGPEAVGFSLLADYTPQEYRGQTYAFRHAGRQLAAMFAPIFVGVIGTVYGWRLPFIIAGIGGVVIALFVLKMPEPIRGYHERKAFGADEEVARRQQLPPSWGEAFRAAWGVRTLRRLSYAVPFQNIGDLGFAIFFPFFLARTHNIAILGRGIIGAVLAFSALIGLTIGGPLVDRILGRNPGRVVMIEGFAGIGTAIATFGYVLAPNIALVVIIGALFTMMNAIIAPARFAISSLVIPARVRNLGLATLSYWGLPVFFVFPILSSVATRYGFRSALVFFVPFSVIGAIITITAGPYVEFDIRSATAAAIASEEWLRAKREGRAKLLVLRDVDVHYESVQVLFKINLDVQEGDMIALLGTNGAGKSTLLRAISGTQEATGGAIVFDGRDITHVPPHEIASHGVAQTPGGRGIFPGLSVRENLELAGWLYGEDARHKQEIEQIFTYFPVLQERLDQTAGSLSGGEQQMLTLAQAFLARPKLLMIDELSLGLSPAIIEQLLQIVRGIHERGTTVIIVEQSVNIALTLAKRAVFLEKGEIRFDGPTEDLLGRPDIMRAVFLKGASSLSISVGPYEPVKLAEGERANILEVRDLMKSYGGIAAVGDVSFNLRENETLGLIGPNGAGKTTVLEIISGFTAPDRGHVIYDGREISALSPDERAQLGVIRRFQDAKLFPSLTVAECIAIAFERQIEVKNMIVQGLSLPQSRLSEASIRRKVDRLIEGLGLLAYRDKFVSEISTGTRRVVDLACVLASEPRVLLLDEPSSGLAQREAENLAPLLQQVRRETGCSMIIIEHDMPLISAVSDELIAMDLGEIIMRGEPDEVLNDERVVRSYLGTSEEAIQRTGRVRGKR